MNPEKEPLLLFETRGRVIVGTVAASSVLSTINVAEFGDEVLTYIQGKEKVNLLLNFARVDYLSSAVLTELLRIKKAVDAQSGHLRLCGMSATLREVFEITNLDTVFILHSDGVDEDLTRFERALDVAAEEAEWGN